jgi:L-asparaginase II
LGSKTLVVSALDHCVEWIDSDYRQLVAAANSLDNRFGIHGNCRLVATVSSCCSQGLYTKPELTRDHRIRQKSHQQ